MKRDMSLIREILFEIESSPEPYTHFRGDKAYHAAILADAGLIVGRELRTDAHGLMGMNVERLTWSGHELLDAIRSDTIWAKAQETVLKPAGGFVLDVFMTWAKAELSSRLGLPQ